MSRGYCYFKSILCSSHYLYTAFSNTQNAPIELSSSLRIRRLEVVGKRENGRARGRHATTSKRLLRRLVIKKTSNNFIREHYPLSCFAWLFWSFLQVLHENLKKLDQFFQVSIHIHTSA